MLAYILFKTKHQITANGTSWPTGKVTTLGNVQIPIAKVTLKWKGNFEAKEGEPWENSEQGTKGFNN